jgi:hypothetical protein
VGNKGTFAASKSWDDVVQMMLSAHSDAEIAAAQKAQTAWIADHPKSEAALLLGGEQLAMMRIYGGSGGSAPAPPNQ